MDLPLQQIHESLLDIAIDFRSVCDKHNIPYFLVGGTLLGAARHKGFIPWDDDLDIGMLREDFEKFKEIAPKEFSDKYFLQTMDTDEYYGLPLAKIRKNGTRYIEGKSKKSKAHNGIFIDIFIYDNAPDSIKLQKKQRMITNILFRLLLVKNNYEPWNGKGLKTKVLYLPILILSLFIPKKVIKQKYYESMTKYNNKNTKEMVTYGGFDYFLEKLDKDILLNQTELKFENEKFKCPKRYKDYLTNIYGDYMTPPPENQRVGHHDIIELNLG